MKIKATLPAQILRQFKTHWGPDPAPV